MLVGRDDGFMPAGLGARDTLRLEAGMPLYGHELTESIDPLTAGLRFACSMEDGREFVGSDALNLLATKPTAKTRVGLLPDSRRPAREGYLVFNSLGEEVGYVTSGSQSPTLDRPIAMAYVRREDVGKRDLEIDIRGTRVPAELVKIPFYCRK